jgi:hypothetical protein
MIEWFKRYLLSATTVSLELHSCLIFTVLSLWSHWCPSLRWYGYSLAVLFTAAKEFWWDPKYEGAPIRWSGVTDFGGYCIGFFLVAIVWVS